VLDYFDDQRAADASGLTFARVLGKFMGWRNAVDRSEPCLKHVNILAHSMGNRVLRGALAGWAHDYGAVPALFRSIFMAAADLANDCLEPGAEGGMIPDCARNVVVYHAHDDLALRSSKVANVHNKIVRRRLGHTGPANLAQTPRNVVAVDCDAFNNDTDRLGHSYILANTLLRHLVETIRTGRVPGSEAGSRRIVLPGADAVAA
jgi:esterase/lipase superfamily enzyme